ncbi:MAG: hypothetical protein JO051_02705, partial [Acidobacteriaceae bacterium]|nr:hypothetical protein [Acidobacteriaceae bacterium]
MRGGSTLIVTALVVCSAVCAQELADSPIIPDTSGEACSENSLLEPSQVHSQPTGLTVLWPAAHGPKRLFGIIPNYRADQAQGVYTPLTRREKFEIARKDSFDWPNYFLLAGYALQSQVAAGGFSHNGALRGFAEYYGRAAGDQVIGSYITEALMPSLLHEDPRYFRLGAGPVWRRAYYAASRIVITKGD